MLGGTIGFSERDSGAVIASQATRIISSARRTARIQPKICTLRRQGEGGAKALGGPAPNVRDGSGAGSTGRVSFIGSLMLCYSHHTVKPVPSRDIGKLALRRHGTNGKLFVNDA